MSPNTDQETRQVINDEQWCAEHPTVVANQIQTGLCQGSFLCGGPCGRPCWLTLNHVGACQCWWAVDWDGRRRDVPLPDDEGVAPNPLPVNPLPNNPMPVDSESEEDSSDDDGMPIPWEDVDADLQTETQEKSNVAETDMTKK